MQITVYSNNFDAYEYVRNGGLSGKIFLEDPIKKVGRQVASIDQALQIAIRNNLNIDSILYCYQENKIQKFRKFTLEPPKLNVEELTEVPIEETAEALDEEISKDA